MTDFLYCVTGLFMRMRRIVSCMLLRRKTRKSKSSPGSYLTDARRKRLTWSTLGYNIYISNRYIYLIYAKEYSMKRQTIRRTIIFISFLLFPITAWYFSPYLIIMAASEHIMNGSFIVFMSLLIFSMFFGRAFCGYLCPAGGLQECVLRCNEKPAKQGWRKILWC